MVQIKSDPRKIIPIRDIIQETAIDFILENTYMPHFWAFYYQELEHFTLFYPPFKRFLNEMCPMELLLKPQEASIFFSISDLYLNRIDLKF